MCAIYSACWHKIGTIARIIPGSINYHIVAQSVASSIFLTQYLGMSKQAEKPGFMDWLKQTGQTNRYQEIPLDHARWQTLSEEDLPGLDLLYRETRTLATEVRVHGDALTTRAAMIMGFAIFPLGLLANLVGRVNPEMIFLAVIPYIFLVRYAYLAYKVRAYIQTAPHPMLYIENGDIQKSESYMKLLLIEFMCATVEENHKLNYERTVEIWKSLIAFLVLICYLAFIVIDAEVGVVSYWYEAFRSIRA